MQVYLCQRSRLTPGLRSWAAIEQHWSTMERDCYSSPTCRYGVGKAESRIGILWRKRPGTNLFEVVFDRYKLALTCAICRHARFAKRRHASWCRCWTIQNARHDRCTKARRCRSYHQQGFQLLHYGSIAHGDVTKVGYILHYWNTFQDVL